MPLRSTSGAESFRTRGLSSNRSLNGEAGGSLVDPRAPTRCGWRTAAKSLVGGCRIPERSRMSRRDPRRGQLPARPPRARSDRRALCRCAGSPRARPRGRPLAVPLSPPLSRRIRNHAPPVPDARAARGGQASPARRRARDRGLLRGGLPEPGLVQRAVRPQDRRAPERVQAPRPPLPLRPAAALRAALLRRRIFAILKKRERGAARYDPRMIQKLSHATVYVIDQDRAKDFYVGKLGFEVRTDATMGPFRWLTVGPKGQPDMEIILMRISAGEML